MISVLLDRTDSTRFSNDTNRSQRSTADILVNIGIMYIILMLKKITLKTMKRSACIVIHLQQTTLKVETI